MEKRLSYVRAEKVPTDRQTDGFSPLYSRLAKVTALSCRLGHVHPISQMVVLNTIAPSALS